MSEEAGPLIGLLVAGLTAASAALASRWGYDLDYFGRWRAVDPARHARIVAFHRLNGPFCALACFLWVAVIAPLAHHPADEETCWSPLGTALALVGLWFSLRWSLWSHRDDAD